MFKKFYYNIRSSWFSELGKRQFQIQPPPITTNYAEIELAERLKDAVRLERYGYKVYSQNDEDGIIAEIFKRIGETNKKFIEFGVNDGLESNGHFLLHKGWQGLWIEGSSNYCKQIRDKFKEPIAKKQLNVVNAFIDKDNINDLITGGNMNGDIDLLSVDIDGNDYHVWKAISCVNPRVVCIEYNAKFPPDFEWVIKYNKKHIWDYSDNQGASLKSLELLGKELGYQLVGTNLNGINAFFVKKELAKDLFILPAISENLWNPFRMYSNLRYVSGHTSLYYVGGKSGEENDKL
ncbi:MAG: hypothetical protein LBC64_10385 [Fibromonadaceae bacterium]|jgi:hypothetical protein|nr:hypothetical protein [Fibromonadaceae bacterium]